MMRFKLPSSAQMTTLYNLTRKLYTKGFYDFILGLKQKIFYIISDDFNGVVVVDPTEKQMDIFRGDEGLLTCHNLFSGDEKGLASYGYTSLCIEEIQEENAVFPYQKYSKKFHHYHSQGNTISYISYLKGQEARFINSEEAETLINVLRYLFHIKRAYETKEEEMPPEEESVVVFEFDNVNMTYACNYIALNSFNFLPKMKKPLRVNNVLVEELKKLTIVPGTLCLGQFYHSHSDKDSGYGTEDGLLPSVLYAASDTGVFQFVIYQAYAEEAKARLEDNLRYLFDEVGLYDTVITDNYTIYRLLYRSLATIGVKMYFEPSNKLGIYMFTSIQTAFSFSDDIKEVHEMLSEFRENFPEILQGIEMAQDAIGEIDDSLADDDDDFQDDLDLNTDTDKIC